MDAYPVLGSGDLEALLKGEEPLDLLAAGPDPFFELEPGSDALLPLAAAPGDAFVHPVSGSSGSGAQGAAPAAADPAAAAQAVGPRGGKKKQLTDEQRERIKAKNRRAQTRYREKQRAKAAEAEAEFNETAAQLERMRLENAQLQERQSTMQRALGIKEEWMAALQNGQKADAEEQAAAGEHAGEHSGAALGQAVKQEETCEQTCELWGAAVVQPLPPGGLRPAWRSIAQRLEASLQQLEAARQTEDATLAVQADGLQQQIETVLQEGQSFCFEHALRQPTELQRLFAAALDDGRSELSPADEAHWRAAASALQLSDSQLERLTAARARFAANIASVCTARRDILARLAAADMPSSGLRALQQATAAWLKVHEASSELAENMRQEHVVCMTFVRDAFGFVLSPLQKAAAIVRSYPFFPDMGSITEQALLLRQAQGALLPGAGLAPALELEAGGGSAGGVGAR